MIFFSYSLTKQDLVRRNGNARIVPWQSCILQTRTESLKLVIVSGVSFSVKLVLPTETQKLHFCVRPWSLLTVFNFSEQGPTDTAVY